MTRNWNINDWFVAAGVLICIIGILVPIAGFPRIASVAVPLGACFVALERMASSEEMAITLNPARRR